MNLILDTEPSNNNFKRKILVIGIICICLIAILISAYTQIFKSKEPYKDGEKPIQVSEEQYVVLEEEFDNIFTNEINNEIGQELLITNKIKDEDEIIGITYENSEKITGKYSLDVKIPYININTNIVKQYNSEIERIYKQKALDIMVDTENNETIYTVDYVAYINENNILSIIIRSVLKEGRTNAQRTIIQTYNYDFHNNKEIHLNEILEMKNLTTNEVENKIIEKIKSEQAKVEELKKLGYNIFERDYTDDMYKIENTTEFFLGKDGFLYLIYPYGNENYTSELDLVIF